MPEETIPPDWAAETAPIFDASTRIDSSRFRIRKQLGVGPFGAVYQVHALQQGRDLALKTFPRAPTGQCPRLEQEFSELAGLRHEHLAAFSELLWKDGQVYFTSELVLGLNFFEAVRPTAGLDEQRLRRCAVQLAAGLRRLHQATKLHQNLKPSNVRVTGDERVVLLDYGLWELEVTELGRPRDAGTALAYLSPEQAAGEMPTEASDWYSLGVMLYQALTGHLPLKGSRSELLVSGQEPRNSERADGRFPADLLALCSSLLAHEPARRAGAREVFETLGEPSSSSSSPRLPSRTDTLLFGRHAEIEQLEKALQCVQEGEGVTVLVDGNSGVGKTALVEHFLTQEEDLHGAIVLRGRCYEREQVPYQGIDSLIDDVCRLLHGLDTVIAESVLPRHVAALVRLFPVLERVPLIAKRGERERAVGADEREMRRRAFGALRDLLARIADQRALIIHIDDLQWGDIDTAGLLRDVLRPPDAPVMLLILGYRREDQERSPCLRVLAREPIGDQWQVHLGPLSNEAAKALMQELLPSPHGGTEVERLVAEASGNPFLLQEVARFAHAQTEPGSDSKSVDVHSALRSRVDRLPLAALELLQTVAVAGHPITEEVARRAAAPASAPAEAWRHLVSERLVRFSGSADARLVETFHDRVRETVLASLTPRRARACHRGLASALELGGDTDPEVLARHHTFGENPERALEWTLLAAAQATKALAFGRALRLLQQAVDASPVDAVQRVRLLISLAEAYGNAGRCVESAAVYQEAAEAAEPQARIPLRRRAASQLLFAGKINEGRELIRDDLRAQKVPVPKTPGRTLASVLLLRAQIRIRGLGFHQRSSIPLEALTFLDHLRSVAVVMSFVDVGLGAEIGARFLLRAQKVGDPHFFALGLALLAGHSGVEAPFSARTRHLFDQMLAHGNGLADPVVQGTLSAVRGLCAYFGGSWRMAVQHLDSAEETLGDCPGVVCELWSTRAVGVWARFFLGDWGEMTRRVLLGLTDARDRGNAYGMAGMCSPFGVTAWLGRDEPEEARRALREVSSTWSVDGFQIQHYWFLMAESLVRLYVGDGPAAWMEICRRWKSAAASLTMRFPANKAQLLHMRGCCALAAAEPLPLKAKAALLREATKAANALRGVNIPHSAPLAELLRAGVAAQQGKMDDASTRLGIAILEFDKQEMPVYAGAARRRLARLRREMPADFLPGQAIADVDAVTRMLLPGFEGT